MDFYDFPIILGISSSQTDEVHHFSEGLAATTNQLSDLGDSRRSDCILQNQDWAMFEWAKNRPYQSALHISSLHLNNHQVLVMLMYWIIQA